MSGTVLNKCKLDQEIYDIAIGMYLGADGGMTVSVLPAREKVSRKEKTGKPDHSPHAFSFIKWAST